MRNSSDFAVVELRSSYSRKLLMLINHFASLSVDTSSCSEHHRLRRHSTIIVIGKQYDATVQIQQVALAVTFAAKSNIKTIWTDMFSFKTLIKKVYRIFVKYTRWLYLEKFDVGRPHDGASTPIILVHRFNPIL